MAVAHLCTSFHSLAGQDDHFQETGDRIGQSSKAFSKQRLAEKKTTSTEIRSRGRCSAPGQANQAFHRQDTQRKTFTHTGTEYVCFCHWPSGINYLQDSFCSLAHFRADPRPLTHTETTPVPSHAQSCQTTPKIPGGDACFSH